MDAACRQFTDEFKREAVGLLATTGRPLSQIAGAGDCPFEAARLAGCGIAVALRYAGGDPTSRCGFGG
jgi:hypothetical protein